MIPFCFIVPADPWQWVWDHDKEAFVLGWWEDERPMREPRFHPAYWVSELFLKNVHPDIAHLPIEEACRQTLLTYR